MAFLRNPELKHRSGSNGCFYPCVSIFLITLLGGCQGSSSQSVVELPVASPATPTPIVEYQTHTLPQATIHLVKVPPGSGYGVAVAIAPEVAAVDSFAQQADAIAALNGGFFDPVNQQSTSYVTIQGRQVADPRQNDRLMANPNLAPYLEQILDRSEFRRYACPGGAQFAIAQHRDPVPAGCRLVDAIGGGPRLLPQETSVQEGFVARQNGTVVRDAIGSRQPNARSAIGLTADGSVVLVLVAQNPQQADSGMSLPHLAAFLHQHGIEQALNLDGGTSSALYYRGKTFQGKVDETGAFVSRPVKSVLLVQPVR